MIFLVHPLSLEQKWERSRPHSVKAALEANAHIYVWECVGGGAGRGKRRLNPWGRPQRRQTSAISPRTAAIRRAQSQKNPGGQSSHWKQSNEKLQTKA